MWSVMGRGSGFIRFGLWEVDEIYPTAGTFSDEALINVSVLRLQGAFFARSAAFAPLHVYSSESGVSSENVPAVVWISSNL